MKGKKEGSSIIRNNYWSPYIAGVLLGLVLLSTFYIMGWGLGVSRAVTKVTAYVLHIPFPEMVEKNVYFAEGYPYLKSFYLSGYMADITLNKWLGTSRGIIILVITLLAFIAFWASEKAENK